MARSAGVESGLCWRGLTLLTTPQQRSPMIDSGYGEHLPSLNREDRALVACYRCIYAPRMGGAYDSQHRTAGIAGRTRRRGGVAARGACAAERARAAN